MKVKKGNKDALESRGTAISSSQILACGYDRDSAAAELGALYQRLGSLPCGLLINSIHCFEGAMTVLSQLPEDEIRRCSVGCYDYEPLGGLLRFPVTMIRQRANRMIEKAYEILDSEQPEAKRSLIKPELIDSNHLTTLVRGDSLIKL